MARILVTGVGGPAGAAVATLAADRGHIVIGADMSPTGCASATIVETVPAATDPQLLPALRELIARHRVDLLIPTVQDELPLVAGARYVLGCRVAVATADAVALAHDKFLTALALDAAGVAVPATVAVDPARLDLAGLATRLGAPFVLKPRMSRGGRGVVVVDSPADDVTIAPGTIAQAFAPGTEYAVQVYAQPGAADVVLLEKSAMKQGRVGNATAVVVRADDTAPDVVAVARAAADALGLAGPADLDIRRMPDGTPVVLEVNARFGAHSAEVGEFFDRLLADHLLLRVAS